MSKELFVEEGYNGAKYYDKDAVDALLAEKDKEIESLKATHYAEMVDAGMRERKLRRALWIAHAIKANFRFWWAYASMRLKYKEENPKRWMLDRLKNIQMVCTKSERKCRAKAEQYK